MIPISKLTQNPIKPLILIFLVINSYCAEAQTVDEILLTGKIIRENEKIFLKFSKDKMFYFIGSGKIGEPENFLEYDKDSSFFLAKGEAVNIYIKPVNPLNLIINKEIKITNDLIDTKASSGLESIQTFLKQFAEQEAFSEEGGTEDNCENKINQIKLALDSTRNLLLIDKRQDINEVFRLLKSISFNNPQLTTDSITLAGERIKLIEEHFNTIDRKLARLTNLSNNFECSGLHDFIVKNMINSIIVEVKEEKAIKQKNLFKLIEARNLVNKAYNNARYSLDAMEPWKVSLGTPLKATRGKVSNLKILVTEGGMALSNSGDIVAADKKDLVTKVIRVRSFQRFIREVSAGVAFTFLTFPKYSTATDSAGQHYVAEPEQEDFKRINFTTMVNFNYHISHSTVHPFWQIGIGLKSDYPTLLTGLGLRLNFAPLRKLALAGGLAISMKRELTELAVGDKVSGEAELEKDLKYQIELNKNYIKPYLGLQYNF